MAAKLPINKLPFEGSTEVELFFAPNGEEFRGTKKEYYDYLLAIWYPKAAELAALAVAEKELRTAISALIHPTGWEVDGTEKYEMPSGWVLEFKKTLNVTIDKAQLPSITEAVGKLEVDPETGEVATLEGIITYRPELSLSKYREIRADVKALLDDALEIKPGLPGVKMIPPSTKATSRASDQKAKAAE